MFSKVVAAVAIGVMTFAALILAGAGLREIDLESLGAACQYLAVPVGVAAGAFYYATGRRVV